jgi:hypothetical protein
MRLSGHRAADFPPAVDNRHTGATPIVQLHSINLARR